MFALNSRFLTQNLTGVQRYSFELFKQLNKRTGEIVNILPNCQINEAYNINDNIRLISAGKNKGHIWEQFDLPTYLRTTHKPLLLNLSNTAPLCYKNQIVTLHDVAFLRGNWHSRSFRNFYKAIIPRLIKQSRHIITVSQFSKEEIATTYRVPYDKISVIYNAPFSAPTALLNSYVVPKEPYILSVGSIDPRKNLKRLIQAFVKLAKSNLVLCLTGTYNSNLKTDPELDLLINKHTDRIKFLGYRKDEELIQLYQNALCFVFPSLYEGFGLPPIEAMANGCPVIASNVSSLPEVCGNAALFCDPLDIADITDKLSLMINSRQLREEMINAGKINVAKYSWDISGQKVMALIERHF